MVAAGDVEEADLLHESVRIPVKFAPQGGVAIGVDEVGDKAARLEDLRMHRQKVPKRRRPTCAINECA